MLTLSGFRLPRRIEVVVSLAIYSRYTISVRSRAAIGGKILDSEDIYCSVDQRIPADKRKRFIVRTNFRDSAVREVNTLPGLKNFYYPPGTSSKQRYALVWLSLAQTNNLND